ncbi:hypothetical protein HELRODRAFT_192839 [Helobdella robusta]|uniref:Kinesin motor domain-containing protein n=1 Tax=Helobdella robusta TaxID=6412 RepID=T1FUC5_HELRO|nr:hypothetical protein HELRODRAFT_192839 [Helobdella robusta]ESN99508.1 hypothetical protein HELRODRAFT_192839 [Helobdella robusta]
MSFANLKPGVTIDIQRTDGRIHPATISAVDFDNQTVTVEWYEKNETKGKEIDIDDVKSLNSELFIPSQQQPQAKLTNGAESLKPGSKETVKGSKRPQTSAAAPATSNHISRPSKIPAISEKERGEPTSILIPATTTTTSTSANNNNNSCDNNSPPYDNNNNTMDTYAQQDDNKKNNYRRKSNCVKEVEKIKQRRNERRAQQMAIKEQNEADFDTNVPSWEFESMIRDFRKTLEFRPITSNEPIECHQICVCLRKRPLNKKELDRREVDVITVPNKNSVIVHEPKTKVDLTKYVENQNFRFDYSFDETNNTLTRTHRYTAKPLVECAFSGGMATCFAYGQTGSGKTHTMGGDFSGGKGKQDCSKGIYVLAASDVFKLLHSKYKELDLVVSASFFEIYSGKVFDLLNQKHKLRVLEDGKQQVQIVGLKEEEMNRVEDVMRLIQHGNAVRTSGQTSANNHSSRSHAVFQIILRRSELISKFGVVLFLLAGNERGVDTMDSERQTRLEGAEINKSLLALKECIRALGRRGTHLPFRASKLTQVLRDSFIGENSKTCMIAMISPGMSCCEHTLNTLRYADRVKELGPAGGVGDGYKLEYVPSPEMSPQKSDLALLRNANEEELSEELYEFHEVVDNMQEIEEAVLDEHKELFQKEQVWMDMDVKLLKMTDEVDYDLEAYAKRLDSLIDAKIEALQDLKEKVTHLRQDLAREDQLSKNIKTSK